MPVYEFIEALLKRQGDTDAFGGRARIEFLGTLGRGFHGSGTCSGSDYKSALRQAMSQCDNIVIHGFFFYRPCGIQPRAAENHRDGGV
jgi:hypothetical protein